MTEIENLLSGLSASEKLAAIDFLWSELEPDLDKIPSPDWHGDVLKERISNPSTEPPLALDDAIARIKERVRGCGRCSPPEARTPVRHETTH